MASSSATSAGPSLLQNSVSDENLQQLMDQRKRKRMQSNRESAKRSRMKKQKLLDDLMAQVVQLRKENSQIITSLHATTRHYLDIDAHNSILRARVTELSLRLQSLNEIITFLNASNGGLGSTDHEQLYGAYSADGFININPWNNYMCLNQPIMASADMLQY